MKKILFILLAVICFSVILIGCESKESKEKGQDNTKPQLNKKLDLDGAMIEIRLSSFKGGDFVIFKDEANIKDLKSIISRSIKQDGIVNMANPDYYMEMVFTDDETDSFYLWVGEAMEKSTLMKTDDTHTIYVFSEENTVKIHELLEEKL